uniref:Acyltransferase n=1 Tax=Globisporangium ultimum (strain ATCC 200006 / CBS 805.95 / DAOM BR144) TaxID=431595 RepID=K3WBY6_GLOUD
MCQLQQKAKHAVEWPPSADDQQELQTLKGKICRRSVLGSLYFVWVCGVTGIAVMAAYSLYAITRTALTLNAIPVPTSVMMFVTCVVLYETYHYVTLGPRQWHAVRRFLHYMFKKYPYFRRNVCIFEEEEELRNGASNGDKPREPYAVERDDKALFAFHPHGILSCGFGMNGIHHTKFANSNTRWLVAENLFWFPLMRDLLHWMDSSSVKKETFVELMSKGQNIGFLPGGFEDATLYERGKHRVYIKNRFGFIKLALQHGYKVYPAYTFGEEHTFDALPYFLQWRLKLNEFRLPAAVFMGSPWCFFMPRSQVDLVTVVGKPLELPHIPHPTREEVATHHAHYIAALQQLFETHKKHYAVDPNAVLEIY